MARSRVIRHPARLHLSLKKKTVAQLRKLGRKHSQSVIQIMRDLAESYAEGRLSLQKAEPLDHVVHRILRLRSRSTPVMDRSEMLIQLLRESNP